jgi:hypothetical protein
MLTLQQTKEEEEEEDDDDDEEEEEEGEDEEEEEGLGKKHELSPAFKKKACIGTIELILGMAESMNRLGLSVIGFTEQLLTSSKASSNAANARDAKLAFYFLGLIGDYDSMHILSETSVRGPPSIKASSVARPKIQRPNS